MRRQQPYYFDGTKSVPLDQLPEEAWRVIAGAGEGTLDANVISGDILAHYAAVAFMYRCVRVRANALAALPWAILRGESVAWEWGEETPPANLGFLSDLPELLGRSEAALALFGRAFWYKERNRIRLLGLRWLTPYYVTPVWDEVHGLIRFDRTVNGVIVPLPLEDVVYAYLPGQHETLPDVPPSRAALAAAGVLKNVDAFAEHFFQRGAIKGTLLTVEGNPAPQEKERLKAWWQRFFSGVKSAWQTEVISSKVVPVPVGEGIQELSSTTLTAEKREDIATAFGVPHSLVLSNAANYATADADRLSFYDMTIIPEANLLARQINRQLLEPLGYRLQFRPEEMSIYQADEKERSQSYNQYVAAGMRPSIAGEILGLAMPDGVVYSELDEKFNEPPPVVAPGEAEPPTPVDAAAKAVKAATMKQHTGIMIACFMPPSAVASLVRAQRMMPMESAPTPANELHMTLIYLGDAADHPEWASIIEAVLAEFAATAPPLAGRFNGLGRFTNVAAENDDADPLYASFDSQALPAWRERLVHALRQAGIESPSEHGFVPHVTLGYIPVEAVTPMAYLPSEEIVLDTIWLAWGGTRTGWPLGGATPNAFVDERNEEAKRLRRWLKKRPGADLSTFKSTILTDTEKALLAATVDDAPSPGGAGPDSPFAGKATHNKGLALQLDPDDDEAEQEALNAVANDAADKISKLLKTQLNNLATSTPDAVAGLANSFEHGEALQVALFETLVAGADAGAEVAQQTLQRIGATVNFSLVHVQAQTWARQYSYDLVKGITATTRQTLQTAVGDWIGQGQPLSSLINQIQPAFGANRAKAIAFTETTRAFAEGSIASFEQSGVVQGVEWMTARDERVCRVCGGYHGKQFPLRGQIRPPAHVGCRCWLIPTILEEQVKPKPAIEPTPSPQTALNDPNATIIWGKDAAYAGEMLNGVALAPAKEGYWSKVKDKVLKDEPALPAGQRVATGLVITEPDGRVWIVEPKGHFGGYQHTFPKGGLEKGLTAQQNALKEAYEESGLSAKITGYVGDFQGTTGTTRYYLAKRTGGAPWASDDETATVKLTPLTGAETFLNTERDRQVLAAVKTKLEQPKQRQPKNSAFPPDPDGLEMVKRLGGSTGAELVRDPATQQLYVRKRGADAGHLREEVHADSAYQALGVKVSEFKLYETGTGPVKLARYIEGKTLGDLRKSDPAAYTKATKALQEHFAADALLGNWDVVGMNYDNVLVDTKGTVWRVDNGGSLRRRAQGALKRSEDWNEHVGEFWTLRNAKLNQQTAAAFGEMTYSEVLDSMAAVVKKEKALLKALPTELQDTVKARMATVKDLLQTGRTLQADQWTDSYNDDFARHMIGLRKAGITERFPGRLDHRGVAIYDETGKPFDNLRGADGAMYEVEKYIRAQGGDPTILYGWMESQARTSWGTQSQAYKYFLAQQRGSTADYFWLDGTDPTDTRRYGLPGAIKAHGKSYETLLAKHGAEQYRETFTAWHAFNYEFVRSVPFANNNLKKGVITLMRTESESVINLYLKKGETGQMLRGAAESTSIYKPVTVAGRELTLQQVPHHRVLGNYFFERGAGSGKSPFLGDRENEFVALLAGLAVTYERTIVY